MPELALLSLNSNFIVDIFRETPLYLRNVRDLATRLGPSNTDIATSSSTPKG
jgi:hypothetical protein